MPAGIDKRKPRRAVGRRYRSDQDNYNRLGRLEDDLVMSITSAANLDETLKKLRLQRSDVEFTMKQVAASAPRSAVVALQFTMDVIQKYFPH